MRSRSRRSSRRPTSSTWLAKTNCTWLSRLERSPSPRKRGEGEESRRGEVSADPAREVSSVSHLIGKSGWPQGEIGPPSESLGPRRAMFGSPAATPVARGDIPKGHHHGQHG